MNRIPAVFAAVAATGLLAAPASALASGSVIAGPVKIKGYDVSLTASDNGAADSFAVMASKKSGKSTQMHMWSFSNGVTVSIKGAKATIKGNLGAFGKINAKVNAGGKSTGKVPAGCTGTAGSVRTGTLKGSTKLVLDKTFFKTVAPKSMKAQIAKGGKMDCSGSGGTSKKGLMLMSSTQDGGEQLMVNVIRSGGDVTQQVMVSGTDGGASVMHFITAQTGASGLDAAADLSTATAPAVSPFLTGTLKFAGEGMGTMATGAVTGDFAAKFDSIGTKTLPDGNDAMLMQQ